MSIDPSKLYPSRFDFLAAILSYKAYVPVFISLFLCVFLVQKKCEKYWPENVEESIEPGHNLTVTLTTLLPFAEYVIRKMTVECVSN